MVLLRGAALATALMTWTACRSDRPDFSDAAAGDVRVHALRDVVQMGRLRDEDLDEASGIVPSTIAPGIYWLHNDSGGEPVVYAIDSTGAARGSARVPGATNRDWEAMAGGPCPAGRCLYIGDVGDNQQQRRAVVIYRVREPAPGQRTTDPATAIEVTYGELHHDVEAMWVGPDTSIWLVTKRPLRARNGRYRPALVLRVGPAAWAGADEASRAAMVVDSLPLVPDRSETGGWITDAAFSESGVPLPGSAPRVAIRTYETVLIYEADRSTGALQKLVGVCALRALPRQTGEALAWRPDGSLIFAHEGRGSGVYTGSCP